MAFNEVESRSFVLRKRELVVVVVVISHAFQLADTLLIKNHKTKEEEEKPGD